MKQLLGSMILVAALTAAAPLSRASAAGQQLEGTWLVTVTPLSVSAGPLLPPFMALNSFSRDGLATATSTAPLPPGVSLVGAQGEWVRTGDRQFAATWIFLQTANNQFAGMVKVRLNLTLGETLTSMTGQFTFDVITPDGTVALTFKGTQQGTRVGVDRADQ